MSEAEQTLRIMIGGGRTLKERADRRDRFAEVKQRAEEWRVACREWLQDHLGGQAVDEFAVAHRHQYVHETPNAYQGWEYLLANISAEVDALESIEQKLGQWVVGDIPPAQASGPQSAHAVHSAAASSSAGTAKPVPAAPIFIVHGRDTTQAQVVARVVERATDRGATILREQANLGRALIEKFELHAAEASYAIVILTPDDEGGIKGERGKSLRARQNVIFEMGYFYGFLGRGRVSVLLHPDVEKPSDIEGIAYIKLDDNEKWKTEIGRELQHAGITFDFSRIA